MPTAAFKGRAQLRASSVLLQKEHIRAQQARGQRAIRRIKKRKPHSERHYSFDHRTPKEQYHLIEKKKTKALRQDRLRERDTENSFVYESITNGRGRLDGQRCRTDSPIRNWAIVPPFPAPSPKQYHRNHEVKLYELSSPARNAVAECQRQVREVRCAPEHSRISLEKAFQKHVDASSSMRLTSYASNLTIMSLPPNTKRNNELAQTSINVDARASIGRTTKASRVAELGCLPFERGMRTRGPERSPRHIEDHPLVGLPGSLDGDSVMTLAATATGLDASQALASQCRVARPVVLPAAARLITTAIDWTPVDPVPPYDRGRAQFAEASLMELSTASAMTVRTAPVESTGWAYPDAPTIAGSHRRHDLKPASDRSVRALHRTLRRAVRRDPVVSVTVTHPTRGDTLVTKAVPAPMYAYPTISGNVDF